MATLRKPIETLDEGFRLLRRRWFPSPAGLDRGFLATIGDWMRTNAEFRDRPELHPLTWRLYSEASGGAAPDMRSAENKEKVARFVRELRTVGEWLGLMETAFYGAELDQYYAHPINRGWSAAYRRWAEDPTFRRYWPILRGEFSRKMVEFCEQEFNLGVEVRLTEAAKPSDPEEQQADLAWLDSAYAFEFCAGAQSEGLANVRYTGLNEVVTRAGESAWIIHWQPLDDGGPQHDLRLRTACGVIAILPPPAGGRAGASDEHELFVWIHGCHRNLQIGRAAFAVRIGERRLFDLVDPRRGYAIERSGSGALRTYFPRTQKEEARSRDQRAMWYAFFTPYGFRRVNRGESGESAAADFDVLRYSPRSDESRRH
ncbi:MAG: hypothetical protein J0M17_24735 [Planctomycetes bacterium]|nr:hypothetical protein [Planctomycetota bacterium]